MVSLLDPAYAAHQNVSTAAKQDASRGRLFFFLLRLWLHTSKELQPYHRTVMITNFSTLAAMHACHLAKV